MKKITAIRLAASWAASNIGFFLISYASYKLGWAGDHTYYKLMFFNGIYFCVGSLGNLVNLVV